ncbi:MAG TPA: hypothetical protein VKB02_12740 [Pyrinomonadaceae bacterium]|nr:hypothetical protein [Pyrinomonadaceae bacterium]
MMRTIVTRRLRRALPLLIVLLLAQTATAHEGPPFPLFVDQKVDGYVVSLWTDPDVGDALFFVIVSVEPPAHVPADLQVQIGVQPASGRLPEAFYDVQRESVSGQVQYRAQVHFDAEELWRVRVRLQSSERNAETVATVEATPPGYGRWDLLVYLFPFLAIGVLWAVAMIRKIKRRTGEKHA